MIKGDNKFRNQELARRKKYPLPFDIHAFRLIGKGGRVVREVKFNLPIYATSMDTLKVLYNFIKDDKPDVRTIRAEIKAVESAMRTELMVLRDDLRDLGVLRRKN